MRRNPAQFVVAAFVVLIGLGAIGLSLPAATDGPGRLPLVDAVFMSTSAATVTGLGTVSIEEFSLFGELILLGLVQVGGFGIMTIGAVTVLIALRRFGLRQRMLARAEIGAVDLGELRTLVLGIARFTVAVEALAAAALLVRMRPVTPGAEGAEAVVGAVYTAVFHGISAFNNAGISLYPDSLQRFAGEPLVTLVASGAFVVGGLGFPILMEMRQRRTVRRWSLHARLTLLATAALLVVSTLVVLALEWTNPATLGPLGLGEKILDSWFTGATARTAGFEVLASGALNEPTQVFMSTLMFIGAGPASTSGGIKVTTFAVLAWVLWAEIRGESDVNVFRRRIPQRVVRQAITVALLAVGLVMGTALTLVALEDLTLTPALFEATSAFGTVGLSTGITAELSTPAKSLLVLVMLAGRVGVVTFVTALALRPDSTAYRYPEEYPIIG